MSSVVWSMVMSVFLLASPALAQVTGYWSGHITLPGMNLEVQVTLSGEADALVGTIDIPQQGASDLPLHDVVYDAPTLAFKLAAGPGVASFQGTLEGDTISGTFEQATLKATFSLERTEAPAALPPPAGEAVHLATPQGLLHGTLLVPDEAEAPMPVVLLIAGSGPTDRDGNTNTPTAKARNNSLRFVAEALAEAGIASLRYDKRGVAESAGAALDEADLRFEHLAEDAVGWLARLQADERFSTHIVLGHSEGALVGLVALHQQPADAFVSLAGAGLPARAILDRQLGKQLPPALMTEATALMDAVEQGEAIDDVSPMLRSLFRPSLQGYLQSWFAYDPAAELAQLDMPTLIIQGTTDVQVTTADAEHLYAAQPDAQLHLVEGMNHVLKAVSGTLAEQLPSYSDPLLPLHDHLMPTLIAFVHSL